MVLGLRATSSSALLPRYCLWKQFEASSFQVTWLYRWWMDFENLGRKSLANISVEQGLPARQIGLSFSLSTGMTNSMGRTLGQIQGFNL